MNYWRVGAVKVATEEGSNLLSSKEVTMATEPQPTSQGILQGSGCLEKGGTVARGPWDPPFQQIPQAPVPGNPSHPKNGGVEHQANNDHRTLTNRLPESVRQERRYLGESLCRSPNVELVSITIPTTHRLNKVIRNTHPSRNSCRTNPKAVTRE